MSKLVNPKNARFFTKICFCFGETLLAYRRGYVLKYYVVNEKGKQVWHYSGFDSGRFHIFDKEKPVVVNFRDKFETYDSTFTHNFKRNYSIADYIKIRTEEEVKNTIQVMIDYWFYPKCKNHNHNIVFSDFMQKKITDDICDCIAYGVNYYVKTRLEKKKLKNKQLN